MTRLDQPQDRKPRFWGDKAPQENWGRSIPSTMIPNSVYESLQEISTSSLYEHGGRMGPVIRDALEEYVDKYGVPGTPSTTMYKQIRSFRDHWVDEILGMELLQNIMVIETALDRWRTGGEASKVLETLGKIGESVRVLPDEWKSFVMERLKDSRAVKQAFVFCRDIMDEGSRDRELLEIMYEVVYAD
jgi:hypothetical protein